ncbi:MAG: hypothetical protein PHV34_23355 [Verrucomicrobiae bacterium]|nr:hypothetical protein [Verrucomicrobiae bacterium]
MIGAIISRVNSELRSEEPLRQFLKWLLHPFTIAVLVFLSLVAALQADMLPVRKALQVTFSDGDSGRLDAGGMMEKRGGQ